MCSSDLRSFVSAPPLPPLHSLPPSLHSSPSLPPRPLSAPALPPCMSEGQSCVPGQAVDGAWHIWPGRPSAGLFKGEVRMRACLSPSAGAALEVSTPLRVKATRTSPKTCLPPQQCRHGTRNSLIFYFLCTYIFF